jgi:hypothetical protein
MSCSPAARRAGCSCDGATRGAARRPRGARRPRAGRESGPLPGGGEALELSLHRVERSQDPGVGRCHLTADRAARRYAHDAARQPPVRGLLVGAAAVAEKQGGARRKPPRHGRQSPPSRRAWASPARPISPRRHSWRRAPITSGSGPAVTDGIGIRPAAARPGCAPHPGLRSRARGSHSPGESTWRRAHQGGRFGPAPWSCIRRARGVIRLLRRKTSVLAGTLVTCPRIRTSDLRVRGPQPCRLIRL